MELSTKYVCMYVHVCVFQLTLYIRGVQTSEAFDQVIQKISWKKGVLSGRVKKKPHLVQEKGVSLGKPSIGREGCN